MIWYNHTKNTFSNTFQRRIDEMVYDIESSSCNYLQMIHFSIHLNASNLPGNKTLLLAYFVKKSIKNSSARTLTKISILKTDQNIIMFREIISWKREPLSINGSKWSTGQFWALSWIYKHQFKTKCTWDVCNRLWPSTNLSGIKQ